VARSSTQFRQPAPVRAEALEVDAATEIPAWKSIALGTHAHIDRLREDLYAAGVRVGNSAHHVLGRLPFSLETNGSRVDLVVRTPAELGLTGSGLTVADVHARAERLGLELCSAEVGPQLRLQYLDQPLGEFIRVAMRPLAAHGGDLVDFTLGNAGAGLLLLGGDARSDLVVDRSVRFVFIRPARP
jgi:hypothetical protein